MAEELYYLSRGDREKLVELWDAHRAGTPQPKRHAPPTAAQAPEVYVARTPSGGIPALDPHGTGSAGDDEPGSADCDIYQLIDPPGTADGPQLVQVGALFKTVYNLADAAVDGDAWVLVARDKFGRWFVAGGAGGGEEHRWRFVKPTSENADANGMYPGKVQDWAGSGYIDGDDCWIYLASGEMVVTGKRYEGEPLTFVNDSITGTADDPVRIYGIAGNTGECAPDTCDDAGNVLTWALIKHRAPFEIVGGYTTSACASGVGTGTAEE